MWSRCGGLGGWEGWAMVGLFGVDFLGGWNPFFVLGVWFHRGRNVVEADFVYTEDTSIAALSLPSISPRKTSTTRFPLTQTPHHSNNYLPALLAISHACTEAHYPSQSNSVCFRSSES